MPTEGSPTLSNQRKQELLEQRIVQFCEEQYLQSLNRKIAVSANITESIEAADQAIVKIDEAIVVHEIELAAVIAAQ
jgi:hypothetical protein